MASFIAAPDTLCLLGSVIDDSGRAPGGFLIARKAADEAELLTLAVAPNCRRAGLGTALLKSAMATLGETGAKQLSSRSRTGTRRRSSSIARSALSPWGGARAIMSMAPTPRSSALPFAGAPPMMSGPSERPSGKA
jgi:GNAT superfamily N-acetyltransferase